MPHNVSFLNQSNAVSTNDLQNAVQDFQSQIDNEFGDAWGDCAQLDVNGIGWPITVLDYPDPNIDPPSGALGYHSLDTNGNPYARVFAQLCIDNNVDPFSAMDHELLEMIVDPTLNQNVFLDNGDGTGILIFEEICDPPERLTYPGAVNGYQLSDFVLPSWYEPLAIGQVDQLNQIAGPLQLASGGYVSVDTVLASTGYAPITADRVNQMADRMRRFVRQQLHVQEIQPTHQPSQHPVRRNHRMAAAAGRQPAPAGQQSAPGGRQPATAGRQPATGGRQPATAGQQPAPAGQPAPER